MRAYVSHRQQRNGQTNSIYWKATRKTNASTNIQFAPTNIVPDGDPPPHNFKYVINNPNLCKDVPSLTFFTYVFCRPNAFVERRNIRQTWGRLNLFRNITGRLAFMVAMTTDKDVQQQIYNESRIYGDIIQQDFFDSYRNITFKGVMALDWVTHYCSNTKYVLKVDDDVVLNIFELIETMQRNITKTPRRTIFCYILPKKLRKFFTVRPNTTEALERPLFVLTYKQFPGEFYPPYCHGMLWVGTSDIFKDLYKATYEVPFVPIEDAYHTGIVREHVGDINLVNVPEFYETVGAPRRNISNYKCSKRKMPVALNVHKSLYVKTWKHFLCHLSKSQRQLVNPKIWEHIRPRKCVNHRKLLF